MSYPINMLTREQLMANVDAMERQGAKPEEIQSYLNSLPKETVAPPALPETKPSGFVEEVKSDIQKRAENVWDNLAKTAGKQTAAEDVFQTLGQGAGLALDIAGAGAKAVFRAVTPTALQEPIKQFVRGAIPTFILDLPTPTMENPNLTVKDIVAGDVQAYQKFREQNPRIARNLEAFVNIATVFPGIKATKATAEGATIAAGKAAGVAATKVEAAVAKQTFDEALAIVRPVLTETKTAQALEAGRGITKWKILPRRYETITLKATAREEEMARTAMGIVSESKGPIENISSLRNAIGISAQKIRTGLEESKAIWNKNELKKVINDVVKPITVKSDVTINNQANNLRKAILALADTMDKKAVGILDLRQNLDDLIKKEFPNFYDKELTPIRQYIRSLRRSLNDFAESKLPEGKLPDGSSIKGEWRKQTLMFDAVENISERTAGAVDMSVVKRAMSALRENPLTAFATGGIATYGAILAMTGNPVVIGSLVLFGSVKLGTKIYTSKMLRQSLVYVLRALEKAGKFADADAVRKLADALPE